MSSKKEDTGVYYIDCMQCQSCFNHIGIKRYADLIDMKEYWDHDYVKGGRMMHTLHMAALVNLSCHSYHNESFYVWPTVIDLSVPDKSASSVEKRNVAKNILGISKPENVIPAGLDLVAVCYKEIHFMAITFGRAPPRLKKNTNKDWLLSIYDSLLSSSKNYYEEFEAFFEKFSIDPSSVEIILEDCVKQKDATSCGFHAYYNFFNVLCNNQDDCIEAKMLMKSVKGDKDAVMRQFTVENYRKLIQYHAGDLIQFGNKIKEETNSMNVDTWLVMMLVVMK